MSLKNEIHQLERLRLKNGNQPSMRWFDGEEPYLWAFSPENSSCCEDLKLHCIAAKDTFSVSQSDLTTLGQPFKL